MLQDSPDFSDWNVRVIGPPVEVHDFLGESNEFFVLGKHIDMLSDFPQHLEQLNFM